MKYSEKLPTSEQFFELFETTGWNTKYKLTKEELYTTLQNSWYTVSVHDKNNIIGFGRIICDGVAHAFILDVIIQPDKQGEGIGKKIMEKLINQCKKHKIRDIQLFCATGKKGFYEKLGFESRPEDGPSMQLENSVKP